MSTKIVFKNVLVYALSNSFEKGVRFFILFLAAFFLSTKEFGTLALINLFSSFVKVTIASTIQGSTIRFYIDLKGRARKEFIGSLLIFILSFCLFIILLFLFFSRPIVELLFPNSNIPVSLFMISIFTIFFNIPQPIVNAIFRIKEQPKYILKMVIINSTIILSMVMVFMVILGGGIKGFLVGQFIAGLFVFCIYFYMIHKEFILTFSWELIKPALIFSFPLIPNIFINFIKSRSDIYILEKFSPLEEIGVYYFGFAIGMAMAAVVSSFAAAYSPRMFNLLSEKTVSVAKAEFKKIFKYIYILMVFAFVLLSFFSEEVLFLLPNTKYHESYKIIPLISLSCFITGIYLFFQNSFYWTKKTYYVLICSIIATIITVISQLTLIPFLGIKGAAIGLILGQTVGLLSGYFLGQKAFPMNYEFRKLALFSLFSIGCVFIMGYTVANGFILWKLSIKIFLIGLMISFALSAVGMKFQEFRKNIITFVLKI